MLFCQINKEDKGKGRVTCTPRNAVIGGSFKTLIPRQWCCFLSNQQRRQGEREGDMCSQKCFIRQSAVGGRWRGGEFKAEYCINGHTNVKCKILYQQNIVSTVTPSPTANSSHITSVLFQRCSKYCINGHTSANCPFFMKTHFHARSLHISQGLSHPH